MFTPPRNWGVPRKIISRRRGWSNKSRGSALTLKVWQNWRRWRRRRQNQRRQWIFVIKVLPLVFQMQSPCFHGHFEMRLTYVALLVTKLWAFEEKKITWQNLNLKATATQTPCLLRSVSFIKIPSRGIIWGPSCPLAIADSPPLPS